MKSALSPPAKAPVIDFKKSLVESLAVNERDNQLRLGNVSDPARQAPRSSNRGQTIAGIAAHIHRVCLLWLAPADKAAKIPRKVNSEKATRQESQAALKTSANAIQALIQNGLDNVLGRVPNCRPDVVSFAGYAIAFDSDHHGKISMLTRQVGLALPARAGFHLWEWATLWRECGIG
jgi:hypothetical protein